jgi:hypothetical protein
MKVKELIQKLKNCDQNKDLVIYSNENELKNYELINFYENEGQVEIHVNEGEVNYRCHYLITTAKLKWPKVKNSELKQRFSI